MTITVKTWFLIVIEVYKSLSQFWVIKNWSQQKLLSESWFYNAVNFKIEVDFESSHIANAVHLDHSNGFLFRLDSWNIMLSYQKGSVFNHRRHSSRQLKIVIFRGDGDSCIEDWEQPKLPLMTLTNNDSVPGIVRYISLFYRWTHFYSLSSLFSLLRIYSP
jgi:hypothetical protein